MRKLLSFIGPTKYIEAYYIYNNKKSQNVCQFIQEALLELFCENWGENDQVVILMTEESKRKNWLSKSEYKDANFEKGLKERLEEAKKRLKLNVSVREIVIPEGRNEEELWEIFEEINRNIGEEDILVFDITHSFRSLPMLTLVALDYVKFLKNAKIDGIIYGAMEALGPPEEVRKMPLEERIIPIFNLTPFARLFDWTVAVERFLQTGNAEMISKLGIEELKPLLVETKGETGGGLRKLINSLNSFSQNVLACRAPEFKYNVENILSSLPEAERELGKLKPFGPLFEKIKDRFSGMKTDDDVSCGLEVASWCLEKGLVQQGFTILRETIVNYVIIKILGDHELKKPERREKAEEMLNTGSEKIPKNILDLWNEIIDYRNDINHGGWREKNYHKPSDFRSKLEEFIKRLRESIEK